MPQTPLEAAQQKAATDKPKVQALHSKAVPMFVPVIEDDQVKEFAIAWLKPMNKQILGQYMIFDRTQPLQAQELVLRGLVIKDFSDARILDDENHFEIFVNALQTLMTSKVMAAYGGVLGN